jgi:hypothetical protein
MKLHFPYSWIVIYHVRECLFFSIVIKEKFSINFLKIGLKIISLMVNTSHAKVVFVAILTKYSFLLPIVSSVDILKYDDSNTITVIGRNNL